MSFCLILLLQIFVYIFNIYLCIFVCANIFGAIVLKPRFKIDVVIMIIWSIVIIIISVWTLQVSTASLPHDCEPCEIKVVSVLGKHPDLSVGPPTATVLVQKITIFWKNFRKDLNQNPDQSPDICSK